MYCAAFTFIPEKDLAKRVKKKVSQTGGLSFFGKIILQQSYSKRVYKNANNK